MNFVGGFTQREIMEEANRLQAIADQEDEQSLYDSREPQHWTLTVRYNLHKIPCVGSVNITVKRTHSTAELKRIAIQQVGAQEGLRLRNLRRGDPVATEEALRELHFNRINLSVHALRLMENNSWQCRLIPFIGQVPWKLTSKSDDAA
jgi:hypothetical protein